MSFDDYLGPILLATAVVAAPAAAQEAPAAPAGPIVSSEISLSRSTAELQLELADGSELSLQLDEEGTVRLDGERIGAYERQDALDRSVRDLLQRSMNAPTAELADLLTGWDAPEGSAVGRRMDRALESAMQTAPAVTAPVSGDAADSIRRLNERIREMERLVEDPAALDRLEREIRAEVRSELRRELRSELRSELQGRDWTDRWAPWRYITRGLRGVFSTLMTYAILVGLGFAAVFFGRRYLEGVADTARQQTLRSGLVGLAGSFLVLPAYILGLLALAISIVGIPAIIVFAPLFPVAVVLAAVVGYLAVAHGAGEALAERRFTGNDWFTRANSYYYVLTGVGLLLVLFLAANIVTMAGPWLGFLEGFLKFLAVVLTWAAFTVGFGAFLISRGGTRPLGMERTTPEPEEAPNV